MRWRIDAPFGGAPPPGDDQRSGMFLVLGLAFVLGPLITCVVCSLLY